MITPYSIQNLHKLSLIHIIIISIYTLMNIILYTLFIFYILAYKLPMILTMQNDFDRSMILLFLLFFGIFLFL